MRDKSCLLTCRHERAVGTSPNNLDRAAFHEAGHALTVVNRGSKIELLILNRDGTGRCSHISLNKSQWKDEIKICVAGPMAECKYMQQDWNPYPGWRPDEQQGAGDDIRKVDKFIQQNMPDINLDIVNAKLDSIIAEVFEWLSKPETWKAVKVVAKLLKDNTLKGQNTLKASDANAIVKHLLP